MQKTKKILLTEGSSLTARETLTALRDCGYQIDILSSTKLCTCAFSRWKHRIIKARAANDDPKGYLRQISRLVKESGYLAVIPTHEQAWLIAEGRHLLSNDVPVAVASADAFKRTQSKIACAELLDDLGISQPAWHVFDGSLTTALDYPLWLKAEYGTAGRSVAKAHTADELEQLAIHMASHANDRFMVQENIEGRYGQVAALFDHGALLAVHTTLQTGVGVGNSAAGRMSIDSPVSRFHVGLLGERLQWHGPLTLDFIMKGDQPCYLECNPRMIEPANAQRAGVNFPDLLVRLSAGEGLDAAVRIGKAGVRTHSLQALLLGAAEASGTRRAIVAEARKPRAADDVEVLTPIFHDPSSSIPLAVVFATLLANPRNVGKLAASAVDAYSIRPETIESLLSLDTR